MGVKVWVGDPRANKLYFEQDLTGSTLFLLGMKPVVLRWTKLDQDWGIAGVRIPVPGGAESLNVSIFRGDLDL